MKWTVIITEPGGSKHTIFVETSDGANASMVAIDMALERLIAVGFNGMIRNVSVRWLHLEAK